MMSANITAASTSCRRTGCSVTSAQSSGSRQTSNSVWVLRISRYSGSERPAWRMNQTGVRSVGSSRAARTRSGIRHESRLSRAMERVGEHPVPAGPLAVRWLGYALPRFRAGELATVPLRLANAGSATWRERVLLSCHWLDDRGNAIVWDGPRTPLTARRCRPAASSSWPASCVRRSRRAATASRSTSSRSSAFWFAEVGSHVLELEVDVGRGSTRAGSPSSSTGGPDPGTVAALAAQEEPPAEDGAVATAHLVAGALPAPDWSRRILDAHAGGLHRRRRRRSSGSRELAAWSSERRPQPGLRAPAAPAVRPRRVRDGRARGPAGLLPGALPERRALALRRADQTSTATRSSTRLKT